MDLMYWLSWVAVTAVVAALFYVGVRLVLWSMNRSKRR